MAVLVDSLPCVVHEDADILVVNKPAGFNTHSPTPYSGEGLFEWLRNRELRWADLAIIHRLDKATSGLIVFGKSKLANRSLTAQFTERKVHKRYLLLTSKAPAKTTFTVRSGLVRVGEKYAAREGGDLAETRFEYLGPQKGFHLLAAEPLTGRTHQIRVHSELSEIPILGDTLYGGASFARVCLHAETLRFQHPNTGEEMRFQREPQFFENPAFALRRLTISPSQTSAYRVAHGLSDGVSFYLERWGDHLLAQSDLPPNKEEQEYLRTAMDPLGVRSVYHKVLNREVAKASKEEAAPKLLFGSAAPANFTIRENSVDFEISFEQGYSVGLFLDQRENRRRLLTNYVGPGFPFFQTDSPEEPS